MSYVNSCGYGTSSAANTSLPSSELPGDSSPKVRPSAVGCGALTSSTAPPSRSSRITWWWSTGARFTCAMGTTTTPRSSVL